MNDTMTATKQKNNTDTPAFNDTLNNQLMVPAQLFSGDSSATTAHTQQYIQQIFCTHGRCNACIACIQINNKQYHNMLWLDSEKNYTREQLEPIFETIIFIRNEKNPFFFIIQHADYLTPACANSLLKSLEEPPTGYHFILLTDRIDQLLLTIRSRCIITHIQGGTHIYQHQQLFEIFTQTAPSDPTVFLKLLDKTKITEQESARLLDQLLDYWINAYKNALKNNNNAEQQTIKHRIALLKTTLEKPLMPGSSKLLWKNLFLQKYMTLWS